MPKSMHGVMDEFKRGALHSGSKAGPVVKSRKQAIAIGLSEQRDMAAAAKAGRKGRSINGPKHGAKSSGRIRAAMLSKGNSLPGY